MKHFYSLLGGEIILKFPYMKLYMDEDKDEAGLLMS